MPPLPRKLLIHFQFGYTMVLLLVNPPLPSSMGHSPMPLHSLYNCFRLDLHSGLNRSTWRTLNEIKFLCDFYPGFGIKAKIRFRFPVAIQWRNELHHLWYLFYSRTIWKLHYAITFFGIDIVLHQHKSNICLVDHRT